MGDIKKSIESASKLVSGGRSIISASREVFDRDGLKCSFDYFRQAVSKHTRRYPIAEPKRNSVSSKKDEPAPFVFSAVDPSNGKLMDIKRYCEFYNLPIENVIEYKLITHSSVPYFNTLFKDVTCVSGIISEDFIEQTIGKYIHPVSILRVPTSVDDASHWFDRLIYTDTHIGMDTDKDGIAMYATPWNKEEQLRRLDEMINEVLLNSKGSELYVDELGDFMDGWDGYTVRQGHKLPQNMSNEEAFDIGIEFKMRLIDRLVVGYDKVYLNNICNDNHAGAFGYLVNSAVKKICDIKYPGVVAITNYRQFINHYFVGRHAFAITHGKDGKTLKFGFKPKLDAVQVEKIDAYMKRNNIYRQADFIEFAKGDSHQMILDYTTSDDFSYFNYPAFSPSSEWVQNNFKKGRSGFVIQNVKYDENVKNIIPKFF